MITKFIGSATQLKQCSKLAIVYSYTALLESRIPSYVPGYSKMKVFAILDKMHDSENDYDYFHYDVPESGIKFNALIMYTLDMKPIGFTFLGNEISTVTYSVKNIDINLNFAINYLSEYFLELDLGDDQYSFASHNLTTSQQHKQLFDKMADYALKYTEIKSLDTHKSGFTNNYRIGLDGKVQRYSGDLMIGNSRITSREWSIKRRMIYPLTLDDKGISSETRIMKISDKLCIISWNRDEINIMDLSEGTWIHYDPKNHPGTEFGYYGDWTIMYVGSNFFVTTRESDYAFFHTPSLLEGLREVLSPDGDHLPISGLVELSRIPMADNNDLRFVKNPIDQSLMMYRYTISGVEPISNDLKDTFDRLGLSSRIREVGELMAACNGTVIYRGNTHDDSKTFANNTIRIQTNAPLLLRKVVVDPTEELGLRLNLYREVIENPPPGKESYTKHGNDQVIEIDGSEFAKIVQGEYNPTTGEYEGTYPDDAQDDLIRYVIYGDTLEIISKAPIEYVFQVEDIEMISDKAIIFRRKASNSATWCIVEILNDENDINSFGYRYKSYNLGYRGNWRKLDLLARNQLNPLDGKMDILMTPVDGIVWRMICEDWGDPESTVKISML